jgi:hypothetical protein
MEQKYEQLEKRNAELEKRIVELEKDVAHWEVLQGILIFLTIRGNRHRMLRLSGSSK